MNRAIYIADALEAHEPNFYGESSLWFDRELSELVGNACDELRAQDALKAELLAALKVVVSDWTEQFERAGHLAPTWCKQARAAIAKAEGGAA